MRKDSLLSGLQAGNVGVWHWTLDSGRVEWSPNLEALHGLSGGRFDGSFSFFQNDIHPDDREGVIGAIEAAVSAGGAYRVEYRLPPKADEPERWLEARGAATMSGGRITGMTGICEDITERKRGELELERRARQQESVARLGELALRADSLQTLFDTALAEVANVLEVDLCKLLELLPGSEELLLRAGIGWRDGVVGSLRLRADIGSAAGYTLRIDNAVVIEDLATEARFDGPSLLLEHGVVSGISVVIGGEKDRPFGVLGAHARTRRRFSRSDVDFLQAVAHLLAGAVQRDRAMRRHLLLIRELRHRVGNLIALIMSLFKNSARGAGSIDELAGKYESRILSLSRAHGLITENGWTTTNLNTLIDEVLAPYRDRVSCDGADTVLSADTAFHFGLVLHELATNAVKYGALSTQAGSVAITWQRHLAGGDQAIAIDWVESGGPPAAAPGERGFGSKLVDAVVMRQLGGEVAADFDAAGLRVRFILPTHGQAPSPPPAL